MSNISRRQREILNRIDVLERDPKGAKLQEAQDTIGMFFDKYPDGARWIKSTHQSGRDTFSAPNLFGGRRHLYGYVSANQGVHSAMDRRGPNSLIQGPLSQVGYVAVYLLEQWLDNLSTEMKLPLIQHMGVFNMVHDSQEFEGPILLLPLASYMLEHACTTWLVDYFRTYQVANSVSLSIHDPNHKQLGIPLNVEFEVDQEIGENLGETIKYDGHRRSMLESMLPLAQNKRETRRLKDNIDIIMSLREEELAADLKSYDKSDKKGSPRKPSRRRFLTSEHVGKMYMPEIIKPKASHML